MPQILQETNWVDVVFVVVLVWMTYKGARTGVGGQIFSIIGNVALVFVTIAYYAFFPEAIFGFLLQKWTKPAAFFVIAMGVFLSTKALERVFNISGREDLAPVDRLCGAFMALLRGSMLCGVIGLLLLLVPIDTMRAAVTQESKSGMFFVNVDAQIYSWITELQPEDNRKKKDEVVNDFLNSTREEY